MKSRFFLFEVFIGICSSTRFTIRKTTTTTKFPWFQNRKWSVFKEQNTYRMVPLDAFALYHTYRTDTYYTKFIDVCVCVSQQRYTKIRGENCVYTLSFSFSLASCKHVHFTLYHFPNWMLFACCCCCYCCIALSLNHPHFFTFGHIFRTMKMA